MRKIYWYLTAYFKKHGLLLIGSVLGAVVLFSVLIPILSKKITIKQKTYIGIVGEYTLNTLPSIIKNQLSVGLTKIDDEDKSIKPLLAERWITEDDGKSYRFILKKGVKWMDGTELTTEDVDYNFKDVETITTPNDIIFKLPDQFAPFPAVVSEPIFKHTQKQYLLFFKRPHIVGIGPYELSSYQLKSGRLTQAILDSPDNRIVYRFYLTERDAVLAFKKGEIDYLPDITSPFDLENWDQISVDKILNYDQYLAVFFNNSHPVLNKNIRQAMSYGIKKPQGNIRALGPIHPNSWAYLEGGKDYEYDQARAVERILDGLPPQPINLTLTTTVLFQTEAKEYKQQWEDLGQVAYRVCQNSDDVENKDLCENAQIQINLKITNFPDTHNFDLLLVGQEIPTDPDQYFLWHSDQATNFTNYQNTRIDSLLEKGRQTINQQDRKAVYQEFQQFLLEDPPAIFLRYLYSYDIRRE